MFPCLLIGRLSTIVTILWTMNLNLGRLFDNKEQAYSKQSLSRVISKNITMRLSYKVAGLDASSGTMGAHNVSEDESQMRS